MMNKTMKAIQQHTFGGPNVLRYEDTPIPNLKSGEILIKVHAVGINPPDWYLRDGYKTLPPEWQPKVVFPLILGTDVSGVVVAVADDVTGFKVGDEAYAMVRFPEGLAGDSRGYAQYVNVSESEAAIKPSSIDHRQAAGAPMSLLTAWQFMIDQGHNEPNPLQAEPHKPVELSGKTVLINGAAGGVGHFAVQLAKWKGAKVIAIASSTHEAFLRNLGVDEFIDYTQTTPEDKVKDIDLVIDCVGGEKTGRFLKTLKQGGALFPIYPLGFTGSEKAKQDGFIVSTTQVRSSGAQLTELAKLLDEGTIRVVIDSAYALQDAQKAHERATLGHIQGKLVLVVE